MSGDRQTMNRDHFPHDDMVSPPPGARATKVRWGVIGSGGIARRRTIPEGITAADNAELVAVFSRSANRNDEVARTFGAHPAASLEELLRSGIDAVFHGQAVVGRWILGASYMRTQPNQPASFAFGDARFAGVDARWMMGGVQVRGEWIAARPFDGTSTVGGYLDVIAHRPWMGAVTAVARVEHLAYDAPDPFALSGSRYTAAARVRFFDR
jgi:hypothetical protein